MINHRKLASLPDATRLRKYPRLLRGFEEETLRASSPDLLYLKGLAHLIEEDPYCPREIQRGARELYALLEKGDEEWLRACNSLRHLLLVFSGAAPADWDMVTSSSPGRAEQRELRGIRLFLDGIRSPFNVGSLFRTAESFGVEEVILAPGSASPEHRRAQRSSMGCIERIPWRYASAEELFSGTTDPVLALETGGCDVGSFCFPRQGILIIGSEELGVSPSLLTAAKQSAGLVSIHTGGEKGSLNVSVASGIVLHAWFSSGAGPALSPPG